MTDADILLRLAVGAGAAFLMGVERSRRIEGVGGRTFGLIGLAAAVAGVLTVLMTEGAAAGRAPALQGVLTGVGFIGAGVVLHRRNIRGLTTAAAIWTASVIGFAAGFGYWTLVIGAAVLTGVLLMVPEPLRRQLGGEQAFGGQGPRAAPPAPARPARTRKLKAV